MFEVPNAPHVFYLLSKVRKPYMLRRDFNVFNLTALQMVKISYLKYTGKPITKTYIRLLRNNDNIF